MENTPADHADRSNLEDALTQAQELCSQANQCVKEKQNSDSLEWIQAHVHCDGLAEVWIYRIWRGGRVVCVVKVQSTVYGCISC